MRRIVFYVCPACGNVITATAGAQITCCSQTLQALKFVPADAAHTPVIETMDGELYVRFDHPMDKAHYIRFVAVIRFDRVMLVRLYPEQEAELCIPAMPRCTMAICCSEEGLFEWKL